MGFASWLQEHRRSVLLVVFALAVAGLAALPGLPVSLFPNTPFPRVVVSVDAGDRPVSRMVVEVTRPVEEVVRAVPGVRSVRSNSTRGSADISADFAWGLDMHTATLQVESALATALPELPTGVHYRVRRMDPTVFPVMGLGLSSSARSLVELRDVALYRIAPVLSTVPGVAKVSVLGGRRAEIQVLVDPARLEGSGLGFDDIVRAVSAANVVDAVGRMENREKLYLLLSDTQFRSLDSVSGIVLAKSESGFLRLADVAEVREATARQWTRVVADGRSGVLLDVYQQPGGDTVRIAAEIRARLDGLRARLGSSARIHIWYDQSELIRSAAGSVRDAVGIGVSIAVLVLWLFLRNGRITLISCATVPVVLAAVLLALRLLGMGINIMTLGGMAAAVGLIVDDAIVMVEHVLRRMREAPADRHRRVLRAAREMARPLSASSAATIVVFLPLAYLTGVSGAFFRALSLTMAAALVLSYLVAYLAVPLLADSFLRPRDAEAEDLAPRFRALLARYDALLRALFRRPVLLLLALVPLLGLSALAYQRVGTGFLPAMDEGGFVLDYRTPPGTSLSETDRRLRQVERILANVPGIQSYSRRTGLALGGSITEANEGDYFIRLSPPPRRRIGLVMDEVRERVEREVPGLEIELAQLMGDLIGDLTAVPQPIEVKLFGSEPERLRAEAPRVAAALSQVPGVVDVKSGVVLAGDAIEIRVARTRAQVLGLDPERVTRLARIALGGEVATQIRRGEKMIGVRVWTPESARLRPAAIEALRLRTPGGRSVRLGRIAQLTRISGQAQITRENLQTMVAVTARISGRDLGSVMRDVQRQVSSLELPAGLRVAYGGLYREQQRSFQGLLRVLGAATGLVFLLLLYLYERFEAPLAVLAIAGLAAAAVLPGLWLARAQLDISAMMGLTMVVGITAEAAIFFMSQWKEVQGEGGVEAALLRAGRLRFRPIAMTALAAIGALLPLALGIGEGAAMLRSLAIAIIAGLVVTVPGVLVALPVLYRSLLGLGDAIARRKTP